MTVKKINNLFCLFLVLCSSNLQAVTYGRSMFVTSALFRPGSVEEVAGTRSQLQIGEPRQRHQQFSIDPFGGMSTDSGHLAEYLLPYTGHGKTTLICGELGSQAVANNTVDLIAKYFNVLTAPLPTNSDDPYIPDHYTFQSILTFDPKQTFYGLNFNYRYHISPYLDKGFWFEISAPLTYVTNDLRMTEKIITAGGPNGDDPIVPPAGYFSNMTQALSQAAYSYGKINGPVSKLGFGDLRARIGYVYFNEQHYYLETYAGVTIPLNSRPTNEFLFEPIIGNNNHFGMYSGASVGARIWSRCERSLYWVLDTAGTLLFSNHQLRMLDLQGRSWSRYMPVFLSNTATQMNPGINSFTLPVEVVPDTVRDLNIAFVYKHHGLHAEFGYHFYGRSAEKLKLLHDINGINGALAIATDVNTQTDEFGVSTYTYQEPGVGNNSKDNASIKRFLQINNDQGNDGYIYKPLSNADLDLTSGAHPGVISNVFYAAVGSHISNSNYPVYLGIGASYELGDDNTAMNKAMVWGKFDLSF